MADRKPLLSASARLSEQWSQKDEEEYERLRKHRAEQCKAAFAITMDKLRQTLMYTSLDDDAPPSTQQAERSFGNALIAYHKQVFTAAGFTPWLARNFPDGGKQEIEKFEALDLRNFKERANLKLKDLVLREIIWLVAEQVRHAPQRINQLFHNFRNDPQNAAWYAPSETAMFNWFLKSKYTKTLQASIKDLKEPVIDVGKVKEGIDKFKAGELNFDDIDESGKYNSLKSHKTFFEAPNMSLFFVIFKYVSGQAQIKYWNFMILLFLKKFGTLVIDETHTFGKSQYKAMHVFLVLDFALLTLLLLNEWVVRLLVTRHRWASMTHSLRLRLALHILFPLLAIGAFFIIFFAGGSGEFNQRNVLAAIDILAWWYIGARLLLAVVTEMLPYSPVISMKGRNVQACWSWKGLRTRYFARLGFILVLTAASSIYEWFLILPAVDTLIDTPYCGEREFFLFIEKYSTQQFVCMTSTFCLWFVTLLAVAIDNGLAFVTVMALVGWIRGYKTQGISRSLVHLSSDELFKKLQNRFVLEESTDKAADKDGIVQLDTKFVDGQKRALLADEKGLAANPINGSAPKKLSPPTVAERSQALWKWAVSYWRQNDYISNKEAEYLNTSKTIDCTLLASPDAEKHISFFINSLDVEPSKNLAFEDIPPSTVLIPVYGEKLEFDWNPGPKYMPLHEFSHLIAKYSEEWLNFIERFQEKRKTLAPSLASSGAVSSASVSSASASNILDAAKLEELELTVLNWSEVQTEDPQVVAAVTEWLSMKDQYVLKTIKGATSYYFALVQLALAEGYTLEEAQRKSKEKCQVILCVQIYQRRWSEIAKILARWMRDLPCFQIVIDIDRTAGKLPAEMDEFVPAHVQFATALLEWDDGQKRVMYRHVLPREQPLRIADDKGSFVQGKSMNQVNGMTFAIGRFVQVLDSNQGAHATEYLKFPALLREFRLHPQTGDVRYRIVGSREYIFTKNLGTVARCHAYQEWSFGTLVLRTYSDLGIRLHYGHPDVFHGPWAVHHSGLSKVNPDINTSEDVFAGMETMKCHENTKHVEHIQFLKGRETGLANMSFFDTKISQGNSGVLRSRDMYALMERLDYVTSFLLFQGLSGHFTTIALMMFSMRMYLIALLVVSLSGASLRALGGITYSTEWLFHAGLTTIIPLIVEFLVEYGPVLGLLRALFFLPISTVIYLFQMQTKHAALMKGIVTGKATYIATGRGLSIYRSSLVELFKNYGASHFYPAMFTIALSFAYRGLSNDLGGGTLPLIMIYVLLGSICVAPQIFNPSLIGNTLREASYDLMTFVVWVGKTQTRMYLSEQSSPKLLKEENSSVAFFLLQDLEGLATTWSELVRNFFWHFFLLLLWTAVPVFLLYPHMQVWVVIYIGIWCSSAVIYGLIFYLLNYYEQPMRIIFIYLGAGALIISYLVLYGRYGVINFTTLYIPLMATVKLLEALRGVLLDLAAASSLLRFQVEPKDSKEEIDEKKERREVYRAFVVSVLNKFFFVNMGRVLLALAWALACFVIGVLLRPFIGNMLLFGNNAGSLNYTFLKNHRKTRAKKKRFGLIV